MKRNRGRTDGQWRSVCILPRQGRCSTDGRQKVAGEKVKGKCGMHESMIRSLGQQELRLQHFSYRCLPAVLGWDYV